MLGGCGLSVPEIQEIPGDTADGRKLVQEIVQNITCEVEDAVNDLYKNNNVPFIDSWGVQITLTLTVEESGALSPSANWLPPSPATAIFNLNVGGSASSDATRTDVINSYYRVQDLHKRGYCPSRSNGLFLLQSNLKLKEWLFDALNIDEAGEVNFGNPTTQQNVLSHEVKFEITTSGNVTPGWMLTRVNVNQAGSLLNVSRDRTHDLLITFGPIDPNGVQPTTALVRGRWVQVSGPAPSQAAQNIHFASQIGLAISTAVRNAQRP